MVERMAARSSTLDPSRPTRTETGSVAAAADSEAQIYVKNLMVDADEEDDVRIHLAALCGDQEGLRSSLSLEGSKSWINFRVRPFQATPLRLAVTGGNVACVQLMIDSGAQVDLEDIKGQTPLYVATSLRNLTIMEVLLKGGARPMGSPKNLSTPILLAVRDGFADGVKLLLQYECNPDPHADTINRALRVCGWPLRHSIVYAHFSCFLALAQNGASPHITHLTKSEAIITKFSIPHTIAKYAKDYPEFVRLYHDMNGYLLQRDATGTTVLGESDDNSPAMQEMRALSGKPLSLKSTCRLYIRRQLGRRKANQIQNIPHTLREFLNFQEYEKYACRTKENIHTKLVESEQNIIEESTHR